MNQITQQGELLTDHPDYVTVTHGMRGYYAVYLKWTDERGGFYEPWNTSDLSYKTHKSAVIEAKSWAKADGVAYRG